MEERCYLKITRLFGQYALFLFISLFNILHHNSKYSNKLLDYIFSAFLILVWVFVIVRDWRYFKLSIAHKPLLEFNESYIDDHINNIRYYWRDIDEVLYDIYFLEIYLKEPDKYMLNEKRYWWLPSVTDRKKRYMKISISYIDKKGLVEKLNNCSIASESIA